MKDRWAIAVMGSWLAGTLIMFVVATENFYTVDRLLAESTQTTFRSVVEQLGPDRARELLRYLSSELNRLYFQLWNAAQFVLSLLALWLLTGRAGVQRARLGVMVMSAIVLLMAVWLQPAITSLGRSLDFVPRDPPPPSMSRFWTLHAAYTGLELAKLTIGAIVTFWMTRPTPATTATRVAA